MSRRRLIVLLLIVDISLCLLVVGLLYRLPAVQERIGWRIDELRAAIKYAINPPGEAAFMPEQQAQLDLMVQATLQALTPTPTPELIGPTSTPSPSATPTITPTPLPEVVRLEGVKYEDQHQRWNYCSPANLSMALTYWGWDGNRDVVAAYTKPNTKDKNVMPSEMVDFVESQTSGMGVVLRVGGDVDLIKRLVAGGFPVLTEKGYYEYDYTGVLGWMGHFQFVTGYDETKGVLIVQDTYIPDGENHESTYQEFLSGWRSFDYLFLVVYPAEREAEVYALLGDWASSEWADRHALEIAEAEAQYLTGIDGFLAWFNVGTSHVRVQEYVDAAYAYDYAFSLYANLDPAARPYRLMWYQTGPYWAYYYSGRYQDVISLAYTTLYLTISEPVLEESFYWRGKAYEALGDTAQAIADWRTALELHPGWDPAIYELQRLGALP